VVADHRGESRNRVGVDGPVEQRPVNHEAVELGVALDQLEVGVDGGREQDLGIVLVGHRRAQLPNEPVGDPLADGDVELALVGEVAVDDGLGSGGCRGDLVHADAGAVPANRHDGGVDELRAPGAPVLGPAGVAPVDDRFHGTNGT
jgi:hypothetical protein